MKIAFLKALISTAVAAFFDGGAPKTCIIKAVAKEFDRWMWLDYAVKNLVTLSHIGRRNFLSSSNLQCTKFWFVQTIRVILTLYWFKFFCEPFSKGTKIRFRV